jgi:hypothetical protein
MQKPPDFLSLRSCVRGAACAALLFVSLPRARAESGVSYKYEDYRESGGRIDVQTQSALIEHDFGPAMHVKIDGTIDAIAGATPNGQPAKAGSTQVVLSQMEDRRKAWSAEFSRQFSLVNVALGVANSRESDYVSNGWSVNTRTDFNQKNTMLLVGVAGTDDDIKVNFQPNWAKKRGNDFIVGVSQLLSPRTAVSLNLTYGRNRGYMSDPYKLVQKDTEVVPGVFLPLTFPENRPAERDKWIALAGVNHALPELNAAIDATYRFYHDSFGTNAHTFEAAWFQRIGSKLILRPGVRLYDQSAADFYHYRLDGTNVVPTFGRPRPQGPFYSSDYRLSNFRSDTVGLKAIWTVTTWLQIDAAVERYIMHGQDRVTPNSAYVRATMATFGARVTW